MHEADIKKYVDVIALEESASPIVVRKAVMDMLERYEGAESLSRKDYKRAQSTLKQQIREMQEQIMPLPGEMLSLRIENIADNGSAQGHIDTGVRVVLPHADVMRLRRRQTVAVVVRSTDASKNLALVSMSHETALTQLFANLADSTLRLRAIARLAGQGALVGVEPTLREPSDEEIAAIELRMTVTLHEDVRIFLWSDDHAEVLHRAMPREAGIAKVEVNGKQALVSADDISAAVGPEGLHTRLAAMLTGYKIRVVQAVHQNLEISTLAEAYG